MINVRHLLYMKGDFAVNVNHFKKKIQIGK